MKRALPLLVLSTLLLIGCATTADVLENIKVGMSKEEVIRILGKPFSMSSESGGRQNMYYRFAETTFDSWNFQTNTYHVGLKDGKVERYGPGALITHETNTIIRQPPPQKTPSETSPTNNISEEILKLKSLKDQGILTEEEFQKAKQKLLSK